MKRRKFISKSAILAAVPFVDKTIFTQICEKCKSPTDKVRSLYINDYGRRIGICEGCIKHVCHRCGRYSDKLHWEHHYDFIPDDSAIYGTSVICGTTWSCSCKVCSNNWNRFQFGKLQIINTYKTSNYVELNKIIDEYYNIHYEKHGNVVYNWYSDTLPQVV